MTEDLSPRYAYNLAWQGFGLGDYPAGIVRDNNDAEPRVQPALASPFLFHQDPLSTHQSAYNTHFDYPDPEFCQMEDNSTTNHYSQAFGSAPSQHHFYLPHAPPTFNPTPSYSSAYAPDLFQFGQYPFVPPTCFASQVQTALEHHPPPPPPPPPPAASSPPPPPHYHQQQPFYQHWPQHQQGTWLATQTEPPVPQGTVQPARGGGEGARETRSSITPPNGRVIPSRRSRGGGPPLPASSVANPNANQGASGGSRASNKTCIRGRGEGVPIWEGYPCPKETLPMGLSLYQIARQYPNHLAGDVLDDFIRARWSAPEIQSCMPPECQIWLEKRRNNNDEEIVDKTMWLQKRLQKRRKLLQDSNSPAMIQAFWESPQPRLDGRPSHTTIGASLRPPQQAFLQKNHILNIGPTSNNSIFHGNPAWVEPPGTSYFRLDPEWVPSRPSSPPPPPQHLPGSGFAGNTAIAATVATTANPATAKRVPAFTATVRPTVPAPVGGSGSHTAIAEAKRNGDQVMISIE